MAVHEVGVFGAGNIQEIRGAHPHSAPKQPVLNRLAQAVFGDVPEKLARRALRKLKLSLIFLSFEKIRCGLSKVQSESTTMCSGRIAQDRRL